jgi:hypothetical protein
MTPQMVGALAALINAVVWPLIVVVFVILFRRNIGEILRSFESVTLKFAGQELSLSRVVDDTAEKLIKSDPNASQSVTPQQMAAAQQVANVAKRSSQPLALQQMQDLAAEYERTRASMASGDPRTRKLELIVTKMRTLGVAAYPYLGDFTRSLSPGQRLAAIAILQISPDPQYWDWLADRVGDERPFVGYQAAVALLTAARTSAPADRERLDPILRRAKEPFGSGLEDTDRAKTIDAAIAELHESAQSEKR